MALQVRSTPAPQPNQLPTPVQPTRRDLRSLIPIAVILGVIALWQGIVSADLLPTFILPSPAAVWERARAAIGDGLLARHGLTTLGQVVAGWMLGVTTAILLGALVASNRLLEAALTPLIIAFQSTPVVAYAPLLVIWFGSGGMSKIVISALIVFFPMLLTTITALRAAPADQRDLLCTYGASRWQILRLLEIPAALPAIFAGLRVASTLAVIGAVVGEFVSANAGLGFLLTQARYSFDTPLVFVVLVTLALMARLLYGLIALVEARVLARRRAPSA